MAYPRFQRARAFKFTNGSGTSGSTTSLSSLSSTPVWTDISGSDVTLEAQAGDVLELSLSMTWAANSGSTASARMTFASMNGSSRINVYNNIAFGGVDAWVGAINANFYAQYGVFRYTVLTSDVLSGLVTMRLMGACDGTARAYYNVPWQFTVQNLGPVDPN